MNQRQRFMYRSIIPDVMTSIIGVTYPTGLVMASDLLVVAKDGTITEERKIDYTRDFIWGFAGKFDSRISGLVSRQIKEFRKSRTIEELIDSILGDLMSNVNDKIKNAVGATHTSEFPPHEIGINGLFGGLYKGEYSLWYYDGSELIRKEGNVVVVSPHMKCRSLRIQVSTYEEAKNLAINSFVKYVNGLYPELSKGIEAFHMTRNGVEEVYYEPIKLQ